MRRHSGDALTELLTMGSWLNIYVECERFWNEGSPSGYKYGTLWENPEALEPFNLSVIPCDYSEIVYMGDPFVLPQQLQPSTDAPFPVHPSLSSVATGSAQASGLQAFPTSSVRTVLLLPRTSDDPSFFLKLHHPAVIGRHPRPMNLAAWLAGITNSSAIESLMLEMTSSWTIFPESIGIFCSRAPVEGAGCIVRGTTPVGWSEQPVLIPFHALMSRSGPRTQIEDGYGFRILSSLQQAGLLPRDAESLWSHLIEPWISLFAELTHKAGLIPECHGQNCVLVYSRTNDRLGVALRDLGDCFVDLVMRYDVGIQHAFSSYKVVHPQDADLIKRRSFAYDYKLGTYLVRPLVAALTEVNPGTRTFFSDDHIRELARATWAALDLDVDQYIPSRSWYRYPGGLLDPTRAHYIEGDGAPLLR